VVAARGVAGVGRDRSATERAAKGIWRSWCGWLKWDGDKRMQRRGCLSAWVWDQNFVPWFWASRSAHQNFGSKIK
jgi:hypothetical protein